MTILTRWEPFREFPTMQDRVNRMNRLFRESYNPQARGWHRGRNLCVGRYCDGQELSSLRSNDRKCMYRKDPSDMRAEL